MKNIIIVIIFFIFNNTNCKGQVYVLNVDTVQRFNHDANVTTNYAMVHDMVNYKECFITEAKYIVDFNKDILTSIEVGGDSSVSEIVTHEIDSKDKNSFTATVYNSKKDVYYDLVFAKATLNQNGYVLFVRWNLNDGLKITTFGNCSTNVKFFIK